jgi:hypothetical protein
MYLVNVASFQPPVLLLINRTANLPNLKPCQLPFYLFCKLMMQLILYICELAPVYDRRHIARFPLNLSWTTEHKWSLITPLTIRLIYPDAKIKINVWQTLISMHRLHKYCGLCVLFMKLKWNSNLLLTWENYCNICKHAKLKI